MFPSRITSILSASLIVESLWAMIKLVLPFISAAKAFCIRCSVIVSMLDVASSRISIVGSVSIILAIEQKLNCKVLNYSLLGKGASGCVYKVKINSEPYSFALKINDLPELIAQEYKSMDFISSRVDCKLPKLYFTETVNGKGVLAMELIDGVTPNSKNLFFRKNKSQLANEIVDNLIKIHSVHNDKYGPIGNAIYASWYDYYSEFAKEIVEFTNNSDVPRIVKNAVNLAYENLYLIVNCDDALSTLAHDALT